MDCKTVALALEMVQVLRFSILPMNLVLERHFYTITYKADNGRALCEVERLSMSIIQMRGLVFLGIAMLVR
jgi:hypothetical protein